MKSNTFPLEYLPNHLAKIVEELEINSGYPREFTACSILFATSVAIGNNFKVQVFPNFQTTSALFLVLVGPAGASKSPPLKFAVEPLLKINSEYIKEYREELKRYELSKTTLDKDKDGANSLNSNAPKSKQFIVQDSTCTNHLVVLRELFKLI
ncbi:MAG: DUF3987 domain-containing protein [Cryomorphaceae bacterium]|nr:DUF3987 domain-containing protein [Cryomorphaceae bacterium]